MPTFKAEESSLSSWAGPYVTEMLGRGQALAGMPYQAYMGPLTAGQSTLQDTAFQGLAGLNIPTNQQMTYNPMSFTGMAPPAQQPNMGFTPPAISSVNTTMQSDIMGSGRTYSPEEGRLARQQLGEERTSSDLLKMLNMAPTAPTAQQGQMPNQMPTMINTTSHLGDYFGEGDNPFKAMREAMREGRPLPSQQVEQAFVDAQDRFDAANPTYQYAEGTDRYESHQTRKAAEQAEQERMQAIFPPLEIDPTTMRPLDTSRAADRGTTSNPAAGSVIQQYMSPYLQGALDPQYAAAQRQADISAQNLQSQYGKAGAYGGSRQGIAEAELQRGLLDRMAGITGQGYQDAFTAAQNQFNTEQDRQMQAANQAQRYGLDVLREQQAGGATQRGIESQGIAADIAQFEQERDYDKNNTLFMQSLLQSLPLETQSYSYIEPSGLQTLAGGAKDIQSILDLLNPASKAAAGGTAATPQYDMNALANYKASYMASGMDEQAATIQAMKDIGMIS
jgi:hypothetical protein